MTKSITEMRADFLHLRRWRKSVEQAQSYTFKAVITIIVTGFVGAVWLGIKVMLGNDPHRGVGCSPSAFISGARHSLLGRKKGRRPIWRSGRGILGALQGHFR
jgi:hypothetical protein